MTVTKSTIGYDKKERRSTIYTYISPARNYFNSPTNILGSRNLSGNRDDLYDDLDILFDGRGRPVQEDPYEDEFVVSQRRVKERAAAAFEEDLAELRRKRRDMQVQLNERINR